MPKAPSPLARGLACLCCRKRKLKCDGGRPVCRQCVKMNRSSECEYDDATVKSRTQKLLEKLSGLENRLRELESEPQASSSGSSAPSPGSDSSASSSPHSLLAVSFSPAAAVGDVDMSTAIPGASGMQSWAAAPSFSNSPSSSTSSVDLSISGILGESRVSDYSWPASAGSSSSTSEAASGNNFFDALQKVSFDGTLDFRALPPEFQSSSTSTVPQWDPKTPLPNVHKTLLLDIFLSHRHQLWFEGDVTRFDESSPGNLFLPEPHPALLNAIYLLGCHFARSPYYSELETTFFNKALNEITAALDTSDRLVDIIEASCLLAVYLYINCRFLEGYCHAFSAARLAVGLGLHQMSAQFGGEGVAHPQATPIPIAPPRTREEMRNRISAFWQVFIVDRCWTIANGLPLALPDGDSNHARIKTPWPMPMPQDNVEPSKYIPALRAKAVALLERSGRLSNANKDDDYWGQHSTAVLALKRLSSSLPMFVGFEPWRIQAPFIDVDLFAIHTAANVTIIHLYKDINEEETTKAMRTVLSLIRQLSDADYEFLDPTLSAAWTCVAKAYMRTISLAAEAPGGPDAYSIAVAEGELDVICNAMRVMSAFFPIAGEHAKKVEQERQRIRR